MAQVPVPESVRKLEKIKAEKAALVAKHIETRRKVQTTQLIQLILSAKQATSS